MNMNVLTSVFFSSPNGYCCCSVERVECIWLSPSNARITDPLPNESQFTERFLVGISRYFFCFGSEDWEEEEKVNKQSIPNRKQNRKTNEFESKYIKMKCGAKEPITRLEYIPSTCSTENSIWSSDASAILFSMRIQCFLFVYICIW